MEIYNSEEEQVDAVRKFFRENGKAIVLGLVIGGGAIFGWRYWQTHQVSSANQASTGFETVVTALSSGDDNAVAAAATFISDNANSYGAMAGLELAKHLVNQGDLAQAQRQLEIAAGKTKDADLLALINLRLARIQFAQNQTEPALATLSKIKTGSWSAEAELVRGNIYAGQGKINEAKNAYAAGLNLNPSSFVESQLKLQLENISA